METAQPRNMSFSLGQDAAYDNGLICGGQLEVFVECIAPQPAALIFGGGHISKSLAKVLDLAGFRVTVIDNLLRPSRTKNAFRKRLKFTRASTKMSSRKLAVNDSSYIVIVTRGHRDDMRVLRWAVETRARYIAMIGSKRKTISVIRELEKEGISRSAFEKLSAPMGLEIGAISPEEIAVSVAAEMVAVRRVPDGSWRALSESLFLRTSTRVPY